MIDGMSKDHYFRSTSGKISDQKDLGAFFIAPKVSFLNFRGSLFSYILISELSRSFPFIFDPFGTFVKLVI